MQANEVLLYALPSVLAAIAALIWLGFRTLRLSREVQRYELDSFRHQLESQISELSQQLTMTDARFRQVNHLLLDAQSATRGIDSAPSPGEFLKRMGVDPTLKVEPDLVFVLMPFNPSFDKVYEVVREVASDAGFRAMRGDEEYVSRNILAHIIQEMIRSRLVIADITGRNANVFYELGIAHAVGKPVLLMSQAGHDLPFDVAHVRVLVYKRPEDIKAQLNRWMVRTLSETPVA